MGKHIPPVPFASPLITHTHTHTHTHTTCNFHPCTAPGDYDALTNFHLGPFNNGVRQLSFNVSIVNNNIPENAKMFSTSLTLDPADQARLGNHVTVSPNVATVTIQDDDGKATITVPILPHVILQRDAPFQSFFAEIAVGFVNTSVTIFESDGVAQLTVAVSSPHGAFPIETSLFLLVSTLDGTAIGLSWTSRLEFDFMHVRTQTFI